MIGRGERPARYGVAEHFAERFIEVYDRRSIRADLLIMGPHRTSTSDLRSHTPPVSPPT